MEDLDVILLDVLLELLELEVLCTPQWFKIELGVSEKSIMENYINAQVKSPPHVAWLAW